MKQKSVLVAGLVLSVLLSITSVYGITNYSNLAAAFFVCMLVLGAAGFVGFLTILVEDLDK